MENELFSRNWLFLNDTLQQKIFNTRVLLCGTGMGSQILITLIRLGFKNFTIADGDTVSLSNLNRQHFFKEDININKAEAISKYAKDINPEVKIKIVPNFLRSSDLEILIPDHDFIINCIDLDSIEFMDCHLICKKNNKIEIFPVNLGFGTGILVSDNQTPEFYSYFSSNANDIKRHLLNHIINHEDSSAFLKQKFKEYKENKKEYDPQNIISTQITSAVVCNIILNMLEHKKTKMFPEINYLEFKN